MVAADFTGKVISIAPFIIYQKQASDILIARRVGKTTMITEPINAFILADQLQYK